MKKNLVANFISGLSAPLTFLIAAPFYIRLLGVEAFGLVGFYALLQELVSPLDTGLNVTLNRELARLSVIENSAGKMRNLLRTMEIAYWGIAVIVGILVVLLAPIITYNWLRPEELSHETVSQAICLMGLNIILQRPFFLYKSGVMGLQHQVSMGVINVVMFTLRFGGVVPVLIYISPTIQCFFIYQAIIVAVHTSVTAVWLWWKLPPSNTPATFQWSELKSVRHFVAGTTGIAITTVILMRLDRIVLSKLLSLEMFGYYATAGMLAIGLFYFCTPILETMRPRYTQLISQNKWKELAGLYHLGCQLVSILIIPATLIVALFSHEILMLWTNDPKVATNGWLVLSLLVTGICINCLWILPHAMQLAYGWTRLIFFANLAGICFLVPAMIIMAIFFGPVGAAGTIVIPYLGLVLIAIPIMHRRLLRKEKWKWYIQDIILPLMACGIVVVTGRLIIPSQASRLFHLTALTSVAAVAVMAAAITAPDIRKWLLKRLFGK